MSFKSDAPLGVSFAPYRQRDTAHSARLPKTLAV